SADGTVPDPPGPSAAPAGVRVWSFETGFRNQNRTRASAGRCSVPAVPPEPGLLLVQQRLRLRQHPGAAGADRACVQQRTPFSVQRTTAQGTVLLIGSVAVGFSGIGHA